MADQPKERPSPIQAKIPPEKVQGHYSNNVTIAHTPWEFIFDFSQISLDPPSAVRTDFIERIIMSPQHAAAFLAVFEKHFKEFQKRPPQEPPKGFDFGEGGERPL